MPKYPESVIAVTGKGKREVRLLIDRGKYVRYRYIDPKTGRSTGKKVKLVLKGKKQEEFFVIPMAGRRNLMIVLKPEKGKKVWDRKKAVKI
ncbi:MAG: hypothetical protein ACE5J7_03895 [Candidatus Aenigmatarchaeota archaeon]